MVFYGLQKEDGSLEVLTQGLAIEWVKQWVDLSNREDFEFFFHQYFLKNFNESLTPEFIEGNEYLKVVRAFKPTDLAEVKLNSEEYPEEYVKDLEKISKIFKEQFDDYKKAYLESSWQEFVANDGFFGSRLESLLSPIWLFERVMTGDQPVNNKMTTRVLTGIPIQVFDLGGQGQFQFNYEQHINDAMGVLMFRDSANTVQSEIELRQHKERIDIIRGEDKIPFIYVLSKSDVWYIKDGNDFKIDLSEDAPLSLFDDASMILPTTASMAFDFDGVKASYVGLITRSVSNETLLDDKRLGLIYIADGSGKAGKTTLLDVLKALLMNQTRMASATGMTVGQSFASFNFNTSCFYAHDSGGYMYFVNSDGMPTHYVKVEEFGLNAGIKKYSVLDASDNHVIGTFINEPKVDGSDRLAWGEFLKEIIYGQGSQPVYDLKTLSRVAQFMIPSDWGLELPYDLTFRDKKEFLKQRYNNRLSLYEQEQRQVFNYISPGKN